MRKDLQRAIQLTGVLFALGCQADRLLTPEDSLPRNPGVESIAVRVEVDVVRGTVRVLPAQGTSRDSGGPSLAILGANEIGVTAGNVVRSAPVNGKVTVTFDAAITNRLTAATLVPSTFPGSTGGTGLLLFPFRVTQVVGGTASQVVPSTDWNGDGSAGSGAPRNFFNDFGCPNANALSDCFRWEQYPAPLGAGETTPGQRVGFVLPKAITSFQVSLVLAADIRSDLPAVAAIAVTPSNIIMNDGFPASVTAVALDALNQPLPWATLTWTTADITAVEFQSGGSLVGTITGSSQVVHGRKVGQTSFTVRSGGVSVVVPVDIQVNTVALVQLMTPDSSLNVGDQVQGDARVKDHSGQIIPGLLPTWSTTDPNVITVDQNGLISAMGGGTADVIATAGNQSGAVTITVAPTQFGAIGGYVGALWAFVPRLSGATVEAVRGGLTFTTTTDGTGHYAFPSIPLGNYRVTFRNPPACIPISDTASAVLGQTTTFDAYVDCPAVVTGKVVEKFGNPIPAGTEVFFDDNGALHNSVPVQSDGSYTATFTSFFCGGFCTSGYVDAYLIFLPASCELVWFPSAFFLQGPGSQRTLGDFEIDCRGRGNVVVDLTISGKPASGSIDFSLTGPAGPYSQVQVISATSPGQHDFLPVPPGDYVVDVSLPSGCSVVGSKSLQVTLAVGATEHVPVAVDCP
jgi:hypothetical protein